MALNYTYNPDGSIKSAVSDSVEFTDTGTPVIFTNDTPIPVGVTLGSRSDNSRNQQIIANSLMMNMLGSQATDRITGQQGQRTFDDFKKFIELNKKGFLRDEGKFEGFQGGGLKSFNQLLDNYQSGVVDTLSPEEAKFIDDLKNDRINL